MTVLVVAQWSAENLQDSNLHVVEAAKQLSDQVHILVAGHEGNIDSLAEQASKIVGVSKVIRATASHFSYPLAEDLAELVIAQAEGYSHILAPSNTYGKDFMPRVAARLGVSQISDITKILAENRFVRPMYAGNVMATVESDEAQHVITVRPSTFEKAEVGQEACEITSVDAPAAQNLSQFIELEAGEQSDVPDLTSAEIVVSGGRGLGSKEEFERVMGLLSSKLGAAIGASRAAVDAGYAPNDWQVGQTGKIVAPKLYIAVGLSGAIQHIAGMKESKVIVAINHDENAPIFDVADYGLVADLFDAVPELIEKLPA